MFVRSAPEPALPPPPRQRVRQSGRMLGSVPNLVTTVIVLLVTVHGARQLLAWAFTHGVWQGDAGSCTTAGACWAFLREKAPFILFGIYPEPERWRPFVAVTALIALTLWSMPRAHWHWGTLAAWGAGIGLALCVMAGGLFGLSPVPVSSWGGLPVTVLLTVLSLALGFPLALALALARRSRLPLFRITATGLVEIVRGVPVLTLLFAASFLSPLLMPETIHLEHLTRALIVFTVVSAVYLCEVLRGGMQGLPGGQWESAHALGLNRWETVFFIILPQAIYKVLPPITSTAIVVIKNTSLVMVVGLFDLVSTGRVALNDPTWPMPYAETYLLVALLYFAMCYGVSRYSLHLEQTLGNNRS